jgi:hypothetical protein
MVKRILDWKDHKLNYREESKPIKRCLKAFANGCVEGTIDGLVIDGLMLVGLGVYYVIKKGRK